MSGTHERFEQRILTGSPVAVAVLRADGIATYGTPYAATLLGRELLGHDLVSLVAEESREATRSYLARLAGSVPGTAAFCEIDVIAPSRRRRIEVSGVNQLDDPTIQGIVLTLVDVTRHHERAGQLERRATTDDLTGLANRLLAYDRLGEITRSGRDGCVAMLDIDHFKSVNDTYGHETGDRVLQAIAGRISSSLEGTTATAARVGGDELVLLLPGTAMRDAVSVCDRVLSRIAEPLSIDGVELAVTATVGLTEIGRSLSQTLREADTAMYECKRRGRAHTVVYDPELGTRRLDQERQLAELRDRNAALAVEARTDPLTALANRRQFDEDLPRMHADAVAELRSYAVVFVDLDYFGEINKASGQDEGDRTLQRAASAMRTAMREHDIVYRIGGEELVALISDTTPGAASAVAGRMRAALASAAIPHPAHPGSREVTASIGVAEYQPERHPRGEDLIAEADRAMRAAKAAGRDRIAIAGADGTPVVEQPASL
jgi:diguanylate cyclase (GGDEF)-like protein